MRSACKMFSAETTKYQFDAPAQLIHKESAGGRKRFGKNGGIRK